MSLFDWGNRTPEQRAIQHRLEMDGIYEQAMRIARMKAMQAGAVGGGKSTSIYGISASNGKLYKVSGLSNQTLYLIDSESFSFGSTVALALNPNDGLVYGISGDSFFKINKSTRELTEISSNIEDLHIKGASSLFYEGDGNFIYVDNIFKSYITSVIRINEDGTATQLFEQDAQINQYFIRSLFKYNNDVWAATWNPNGPETIISMFKINVSTGEPLSGLTQITLSVPGVVEYDIYSLYNVISINNIVYASISWNDGLNNRYDLFQINMNTGYAKVIQELKNEDDNIYIWNVSYF